GSVEFKTRLGLDGAVSYRYMDDRPANAHNTLVAQGYFVTDLLVNYRRGGWEIGLDVQNLLNTAWRETQFETQSRLQGEPGPVDGISFTPGMPLMGRLRFGVRF